MRTIKLAGQRLREKPLRMEGRGFQPADPAFLRPCVPGRSDLAGIRYYRQ